ERAGRTEPHPAERVRLELLRGVQTARLDRVGVGYGSDAQYLIMIRFPEPVAAFGEHAARRLLARLEGLSPIQLGERLLRGRRGLRLLPTGELDEPREAEPVEER